MLWECRLGILVWQDMPVMYWEDPFNSGISYRAPKEKAQHQHELQRMVEVLRFMIHVVIIVIESLMLGCVLAISAYYRPYELLSNLGTACLLFFSRAAPRQVGAASQSDTCFQ